MTNVAFDIRTTAPDAMGDGSDLMGAIPKLYALRRGLPSYYQGLMDDADEVLRVAAVAALLDLGTVHHDDFPRVVEMSRYGAVKPRAFKYFLHNYEYALADK